MGCDARFVRRASIADILDVFRLVEEYYEAVSVVERDSREALMAYLTNADCGVWLAYCDAAAAGCILYHPLPRMIRAGEVKRLYVQPLFRNRGLAKMLLDALERFARDRGDESLYLDTNDGLQAAIAFYKRSGYVLCDRYNDNPQATIFMRKRLT